MATVPGTNRASLATTVSSPLVSGDVCDDEHDRRLLKQIADQLSLPNEWIAAKSDSDLVTTSVSGSAVLSLGFPRVRDATSADLAARRLVYWPRGVQEAIRIGVASSRLSRPWERHAEWFAALRQIATSLEAGQVLFTVAGTTAVPMILRCVELFGVTALIARISPPTASIETWWRRVHRRSQRRTRNVSDSLCYEIDVSPPIDVGLTKSEPEQANDPSEFRDRALALWSDQLKVLYVRGGGIWERLLKEPQIRARVPCPSCVSRATPLPIIEREHEQWSFAPGIVRVSQLTTHDAPRWQHLTHWTRAPRGGWCGESPDQYIDRLLSTEFPCVPTALDVLQRIVSERRIRASSRLIRGGMPVVSLTAVPLDALRERRVYRRHLQRFDFEPYGICMRRDVLSQQGARPVIYGDEACWERLTPDQRPYFQTAQSKGAAVINWASEQEWRIVGDIDLSAFGPDELIIFVRSRQEAERIESRGEWPVIALYDAD